MKEKSESFHCKVFELINTFSIVRAMRERFLKLYHGDPMSISTANHIYGELRKRGYSVRNWAIERGFSPAPYRSVFTLMPLASTGSQPMALSHRGSWRD